MRHEIEILDGGMVKDSIPEKMFIRDARIYRVINPIFKNGKLHEKGSEVILDAVTGGRFVKTGDLEEN